MPGDFLFGVWCGALLGFGIGTIFGMWLWARQMPTTGGKE